MSSLSSIPLA